MHLFSSCLHLIFVSQLHNFFVFLLHKIVFLSPFPTTIFLFRTLSCGCCGQRSFVLSTVIVPLSPLFPAQFFPLAGGKLVTTWQGNFMNLNEPDSLKLLLIEPANGIQSDGTFQTCWLLAQVSQSVVNSLIPLMPRPYHRAGQVCRPLFPFGSIRFHLKSEGAGRR